MNGLAMLTRLLPAWVLDGPLANINGLYYQDVMPGTNQISCLRFPSSCPWDEGGARNQRGGFKTYPADEEGSRPDAASGEKSARAFPGKLLRLLFGRFQGRNALNLGIR